MPRSRLDQGIDISSNELYPPQQRQQQPATQSQEQQHEAVVVVPWMPDANMRWLDLYHICEMLGLLADDDDYPDEDEMRGRLRDRYITHWQQLRQQPSTPSQQQQSESSPFMLEQHHPDSEEEESVHEDGPVITVFENNESATTTPAGEAPLLEAVVAEENDVDDGADLSVFLPAEQ